MKNFKALDWENYIPKPVYDGHPEYFEFYKKALCVAGKPDRQNRYKRSSLQNALDKRGNRLPLGGRPLGYGQYPAWQNRKKL